MCPCFFFFLMSQHLPSEFPFLAIKRNTHATHAQAVFKLVLFLTHSYHSVSLQQQACRGATRALFFMQFREQADLEESLDLF